MSNMFRLISFERSMLKFMWPSIWDMMIMSRVISYHKNHKGWSWSWRWWWCDVVKHHVVMVSWNGLTLRALGPPEPLLIHRWPHLHLYIQRQYMFSCNKIILDECSTIPDIYPFFYTDIFWDLKFLHPKVRKFVTKISSRQNSVKLHIVYKITHCV